MAFDPDAYLASRKKPIFDPDAYLASRAATSVAPPPMAQEQAQPPPPPPAPAPAPAPAPQQAPFNPLLQGGEGKPSLDLRIKRALGIQDSRDAGPPTASEVTARQQAAAYEMKPMERTPTSPMQKAILQESTPPNEQKKEWWQSGGVTSAPVPKDTRNIWEKFQDLTTKDTYVGQQALSLATLAIDFIPSAIRGLRSNAKNFLEYAVGKELSGKIRKKTKYAPFIGGIIGESKEFDAALDASGNLRKEAYDWLIESAKEQGGTTGAVIAGVADGIANTILTLKTFQALKIGYGQEAVKGVGAFAKSWGVVKNAALRAGLMTATKAHDSFKEFSKSFAISLAYQSTPAVSRHLNNTASVIAADIALNSIITAPQINGMIDAAWEQAEAEGGTRTHIEKNAAIYSTIALIQAVGSDIVFGAMTRSFKNAPPQAKRILENAQKQAQGVSAGLPDKPMPLPTDVRGPETNPALATPERPVLISNQPKAEEGTRISPTEEPINPLLEPEKVQPPAQPAIAPAGPAAKAASAPVISTESKPQEAPNAVPEQGPRSVLQPPPEGIGGPGSERGRVEQGQQGAETPVPRQAEAPKAEEITPTQAAKIQKRIDAEWPRSPEERHTRILEAKEDHAEAQKVADAFYDKVASEEIPAKPVAPPPPLNTALADQLAGVKVAPEQQQPPPEGASKGQAPGQKEEVGKPFNGVVYRGISKTGVPSDNGDIGIGEYHTTSKSAAKQYGNVVKIPVELKNPLRITGKQASVLAEKYGTLTGTASERKLASEKLTRDLSAKGYDGIIASKDDTDGDTIVVFPKISAPPVAQTQTTTQTPPAPEAVRTPAAAEQGGASISDKPDKAEKSPPVIAPMTQEQVPPEAKPEPRYSVRTENARAGIYKVISPDGMLQTVRAESKEAAAQQVKERDAAMDADAGQKLVDDAKKMVEAEHKKNDKEGKAGYVAPPGVSEAGEIANRAMERFFGVFRAFGEQYWSNRPQASRMEQAYHERAAAVNRGISETDKILKEVQAQSGKRTLADSVSVALALEEGISRDSLPASARPLYDAVKNTMDSITAMEKAAGTLGEGFPEGTRRAIQEKIAELQSNRMPSAHDQQKIQDLQAQLSALDKFARYMPHGIVARRVIQQIFENGNGRQLKDISERLEQSHHQRKGMATLREYLTGWEKEDGIRVPPILSAEDLDVGKLLMNMSVSANQKIAMKSLMDYGFANGYIKYGPSAPGSAKDWFEMPQLARSANVFKVTPPKGQKIWVDRLFGLGLEELAGSNVTKQNAFQKLLMIAKVGQFYNPRIIWSYNVQQRVYGGGLELNPIKDVKNAWDAKKAVFSENEDYQLADKLGVFQTPDNIPRAAMDQMVELTARQTRADISSNGRAMNLAKQIVEKATGQVFSSQAWKDKGWAALSDAILLPLRPITQLTWLGDKIQRMHTFYNLTRKGMSPELAAKRTASMHGAYSLVGKEYKAFARNVFFVHSFRMLMPVETVRAYTTPVKLAIQKWHGKEIPQGEAARATRALIGNVLLPTLIDAFLRSNGWVSTEEEEEIINKSWIGKLRIPIGDTGYRVILALPNWKYKKTFTYNGEDREVVLGINNIANMLTKWFVRARGSDIVSPGGKDLPGYSVLKWEVNPLYRIMLDVFDNTSSFGGEFPRGAAGNDFDAAIWYIFSNIIRLYGDAYWFVSDDKDSGIYKKRQDAELDEALNLGEKVTAKVFGYAYTRQDKATRYESKMDAIARSVSRAGAAAETEFSGDELAQRIDHINELRFNLEKKITRMYDMPESFGPIVFSAVKDAPTRESADYDEATKKHGERIDRLVRYAKEYGREKAIKSLNDEFARKQREQTSPEGRMKWAVGRYYDDDGKLTNYGKYRGRLNLILNHNGIK